MNNRTLNLSAFTLLLAGSASVYAANSAEVNSPLGENGKLDNDSLLVPHAVARNTEQQLPETVSVPGRVPARQAEPEIVKVVQQVNLNDYKAALFASGRSAIRPATAASMEKLLTQLRQKKNLQLHFIGHTDNQRLSANARKIYRDNQGLSEHRARAIADYFQQHLGLEPSAVTFEGKGETQPVADNGTSGGMAKNRRVEMQVSYDEIATSTKAGKTVYREHHCQLPQGKEAASTSFKISVDGEPLESQPANRVDQQRCTDVALERASIQLQYDNLNVDPKLNVTLVPIVQQSQQSQQQDTHQKQKPDTHEDGEQISYVIQGYSNYLAWIERAELRVFEKDASPHSQPLAVVPLDQHLAGEWQPGIEFSEDVSYRLRVYDEQGRFDETGSQSLWRSLNAPEQAAEAGPVTLPGARLAGYGESRLELQSIPVSGGTLTANGEAVPEHHQVFLMGMPVPVTAEQTFVSRQIVPAGTYGVEVAVLNDDGEGELFWRELQFDADDWFYVGMADFTLGENSVSGPAEQLTGDEQHFDGDLFLDGRLAFYTKGKWRNDYTVTASIDTREEPIEDLFSNIDHKDPRSQLRRLEEEQHYSVYGDDSTLIEDAPTQGRFYFKIEDDRSHALWGNFATKLSDTDLARIERSLYGAQLQWGSEALTETGEHETFINGFIAESGTNAAHEEFRGTGGTLYYLQHQDITQGSEQISIEVRDKDSGLVITTRHLAVGQDYDIDSSQGRVLLTRALSSTADDSLLLRDSSLSGNPVFLVVNYEYTPGFDDLHEMTTGGRISHWVNDNLKVGLTASNQNQTGGDQELLGGDVTLQYTPETYLKLETAQTDGPGVGEQLSGSGGITFNSVAQDRSAGIEADAWRLESGFTFADLGLTEATEGGDINKGHFYWQRRDAGFSGLGQLTRYDTDQIGASLSIALSDDTDLLFKIDDKDESGGVDTHAAELNLDVQLTDHWSVVAGLRREDLDSATTLTGPVAQEQGQRTDGALQLAYDSAKEWKLYGFAQGTLDRDDSREINNRVGVGGAYQVTDKYRVSAEVSDGKSGFGAKAGSDYQYADQSNLYLNYETDPDFSNNAFTGNSLRGGSGQLTGGVKHRYSDSTSVYSEARYQNGSRESGLSHAYGVDYTPNEHWSFGASYENGELKQADVGEIERQAITLSMGYASEQIKYGTSLEYRDDNTINEDRISWLIRNNLGYQVNPDWRAQLRVDVAISDSSNGDHFNSDFTEGLLGFAYRPIDNDKLNALISYHYLEDLAPAEQFTSSQQQNDYQQRSQVLAVDATYDLTARWSIGGKYAYRNSEVRLGRETGPWFDSDAHLYIVRADWHVVRNWDFLIEGRMLKVDQADDEKAGALVAIHRHLGEHFKLGVGYNFTEFSDDLTHYDYDAEGWFVNLVGKL